MKVFIEKKLLGCCILFLFTFFLYGFDGKEIPSDHGAYFIDIKMKDKPVVGGNRFEMVVYDGKTKKIIKDKLLIEVVPWMALHEHGTLVESVVTELAEGKFLVENVNFTMPGPWQIHIRISRENREDTAIHEVKVTGSGEKEMVGHNKMKGHKME